MTQSDFQDALIEFTQGLSWRDVPQSTRDVFSLSLFDWISVALAGAKEPVSVAVRDMVLVDGGKGVADMFCADAVLPARAAALANGTCSHALDYDDTHFLHIGHPSVVIFSAALAVAQQVGASGRSFLEASLAGYEASCRVGHWLGRSHYEAGFHMTATAGCFGAALAAARLLGADRAQISATLGLASTRAAGLKGQFGSMGKPYNAGMAAAGGVETALLAVSGMTSDSQGLENFAAAHAGVMEAAALDGLGRVFASESVSHKFHACCHGTHAALEALNKLAVEVGEVTKVEVVVHPRWLKVCNKAVPETGLDAKFSYRMCLAFALAGLDTGALATFSDAHCADRQLQVLRDLVSVEGDTALADGAARVVVTCNDGMVRQAAYDLDQPLEIKERSARVHGKAAALLGEAKAHRIWQHVEQLDAEPDLAGLVGSIKRSA